MDIFPTAWLIALYGLVWGSWRVRACVGIVGESGQRDEDRGPGIRG